MCKVCFRAKCSNRFFSHKKNFLNKHYCYQINIRYICKLDIKIQ